MSLWGQGNFQDDAAADYLSVTTRKLMDEIEAHIHASAELAPGEYWATAIPCGVDLLVLIARQQWGGHSLPTSAQAESWRMALLEALETDSDGVYEGKPERKRLRERVLRQTFDGLLDVIGKSRGG